jgi:acid phosphatase type 7
MKVPMLIFPCCLILLAACGSTSGARPGPTAPSVLAPDLKLEIGDDDALLVGVGDIADCNHSASALATGDLIRSFPEATVFTTGDNAYLNGTTKQFQNCYDPVWGSFKERTRPTPGNHDYGIYPPAHRNNADPYFQHFGTNAGLPGKGYYSYDLGGWHIVSLNSMAGQKNISTSMKDQLKWLEQDLEDTDKSCILAYWHHPLYSSGHHGYQLKDPGRDVGPLWDVLYKHGADVILNGHDHHYERFERLNPMGKPDPKGILQFVVGTGGREVERIQKELTTSDEILDGPADFGILALALRPNSYEWRFLKTDGTVGDASTGPQECH